VLVVFVHTQALLRSRWSLKLLRHRRPETAAARSAQAQSQHNFASGKPMLRPFGHLYGFLLDLRKPPRCWTFIVLFSTKSLFNLAAYPLILRKRQIFILCVRCLFPLLGRHTPLPRARPAHLPGAHLPDHQLMNPDFRRSAKRGAKSLQWQLNHSYNFFQWKDMTLGKQASTRLKTFDTTQPNAYDKMQ